MGSFVEKKSDPVEAKAKERSATVKRAPKKEDPRIKRLKACLQQELDFLNQFSRTALRRRMTSVEKLEHFAEVIRLLERLSR